MVNVQPVGQPVVENGVDAGIEEKNLQFAAGRGIAALVGGKQAAQSGHSFCHKNCSLCRPGGRKDRFNRQERIASKNCGMKRRDFAEILCVFQKIATHSGRKFFARRRRRFDSVFPNKKRLPYQSTRGDESRFHSHLSLKGPLTEARRRASASPALPDALRSSRRRRACSR